MKQSTAKSTSNTQSPLLKTAGLAFWNLAQHYRLTLADAGLLLGISETNRTRLSKMSRSKSIPEESLANVSHLMGIHKSLRIIYPENRELVYMWLKRPSKDLDFKSPLEYVRSQSPELRPFAIADLRARLDRERISGPF